MSPEVNSPSPLPPILPNSNLKNDFAVASSFPETDHPSGEKIKNPILNQLDVRKPVFEDPGPVDPKLVNPYLEDYIQVCLLLFDAELFNPYFEHPILTLS